MSEKEIRALNQAVELRQDDKEAQARAGEVGA